MRPVLKHQQWPRPTIVRDKHKRQMVKANELDYLSLLLFNNKLLNFPVCVLLQWPTFGNNV